MLLQLLPPSGDGVPGTQSSTCPSTGRQWATRYPNGNGDYTSKRDAQDYMTEAGRPIGQKAQGSESSMQSIFSRPHRLVWRCSIGYYGSVMVFHKCSAPIDGAETIREILQLWGVTTLGSLIDQPGVPTRQNEVLL